MHGFRDNEVLLSTGNDVIVISLLAGAINTDKPCRAYCDKARQSKVFLDFLELALRLHKSVDYWHRYAEPSEL